MLRSSMTVALGLLAAAAAPPIAAQPAGNPAVVRGLYNWVHSTADAERAFAFYHDVLGIALAPSPFTTSCATTCAAPDRW